MRNIVPDLIIMYVFSFFLFVKNHINFFFNFFNSLIVLVTLALAHILSYTVYELISDGKDNDKNLAQLLAEQKGQFSFALKLLVNCFGYACVFIPLFLVYKYTKKIKYVDRGGKLHTIKLFIVTSKSHLYLHYI